MNGQFPLIRSINFDPLQILAPMSEDDSFILSDHEPVVKVSNLLTLETKEGSNSKKVIQKDR